jgi:hypothetical protein
MTEAEWLACNDPAPMLGLLHGKASDRKFRLFAVACCRRIWHLLVDHRSQQAVEEAERYAEGLTTETALLAAVSEAKLALRSIQREGGPATAHAGAARAAVSLGKMARKAAEHAANDAMWAEDWEGVQHRLASREERKQLLEEPLEAGIDRARKELAQIRLQQSVLLHEIVGNPFRAISFNVGRLAQKARRLAKSIYTKKTFERMPNLAEILEEAGCTDAEILAHCRGPGPHVRGCWAVDLLLGKE